MLSIEHVIVYVPSSGNTNHWENKSFMDTISLGFIFMEGINPQRAFFAVGILLMNLLKGFWPAFVTVKQKLSSMRLKTNFFLLIFFKLILKNSGSPSVIYWVSFWIVNCRSEPKAAKAQKKICLEIQGKYIF